MQLVAGEGNSQAAPGREGDAFNKVLSQPSPSPVSPGTPGPLHFPLDGQHAVCLVTASALGWQLNLPTSLCGALRFSLVGGLAVYGMSLNACHFA